MKYEYITQFLNVTGGVPPKDSTELALFALGLEQGIELGRIEEREAQKFVNRLIGKENEKAKKS